MVKTLFAIPFTLVAFFANAQEMEADSILIRHLEVVGGKSNWQMIKSFYVSSSFFSNPDYLQSDNPAIQDLLTAKLKNTYYQHPDNYRIEIYENGELTGTFLMNAEGAKGYNHKGRYEESYSDKMCRLMMDINQLYTLGPTPLIMSASEAGSIEYDGLVQIYGKNCHKLMFTANGLTGKFIVYLDAETYLIHASSNVNEPEKYKLYSDYRSVGKVKVPHNFSSYKRGEKYEEFKILNIEINNNMDEYLFSNW